MPKAAGQLTKVLAGLRHTFVVADATLPDCPLVYASEGCELASVLAWGALHCNPKDACSGVGRLSTCILELMGNALRAPFAFACCLVCSVKVGCFLCIKSAGRASPRLAHLQRAEHWGFLAQVSADDRLLRGGGAGPQLVRAACPLLRRGSWGMRIGRVCCSARSFGTWKEATNLVSNSMLALFLFCNWCVSGGAGQRQDHRALRWLCSASGHYQDAGC